MWHQSSFVICIAIVQRTKLACCYLLGIKVHELSICTFIKALSHNGSLEIIQDIIGSLGQCKLTQVSLNCILIKQYTVAPYKQISGAHQKTVYFLPPLCLLYTSAIFSPVTLATNLPLHPSGTKTNPFASIQFMSELGYVSRDQNAANK